MIPHWSTVPFNLELVVNNDTTNAAYTAADAARRKIASEYPGITLEPDLSLSSYCACEERGPSIDGRASPGLFRRTFGDVRRGISYMGVPWLLFAQWYAVNGLLVPYDLSSVVKRVTLRDTEENSGIPVKHLWMPRGAKR
jgi:hypothetical protein